METLRFSEQWLINKLDGLPPLLRVLFAAIAAERLLPAYLSYSHLTGRGNPKSLSAALDRLWRDIEGQRMDSEQVQESLDLVMKLIPREDDNSWVKPGQRMLRQRSLMHCAAEKMGYPQTRRGPLDEPMRPWIILSSPKRVST